MLFYEFFCFAQKEPPEFVTRQFMSVYFIFSIPFCVPEAMLSSPKPLPLGEVAHQRCDGEGVIAKRSPLSHQQIRFTNCR